jgi:hypothetical protein
MQSGVPLCHLIGQVVAAHCGGTGRQRLTSATAESAAYQAPNYCFQTHSERAAWVGIALSTPDSEAMNNPYAQGTLHIR